MTKYEVIVTRDNKEYKVLVTENVYNAIAVFEKYEHASDDVVINRTMWTEDYVVRLYLSNGHRVDLDANEARAEKLLGLAKKYGYPAQLLKVVDAWRYIHCRVSGRVMYKPMRSEEMKKEGHVENKVQMLIPADKEFAGEYTAATHYENDGDKVVIENVLNHDVYVINESRNVAVYEYARA